MHYVVLAHDTEPVATWRRTGPICAMVGDAVR